MAWIITSRNRLRRLICEAPVVSVMAAIWVSGTILGTPLASAVDAAADLAALGAEVYAGPVKEIGFHPISVHHEDGLLRHLADVPVLRLVTAEYEEGSAESNGTVLRSR